MSIHMLCLLSYFCIFNNASQTISLLLLYTVQYILKKCFIKCRGEQIYTLEYSFNGNM